MSDHVTISSTDGIVDITLNRPDVGNLIDNEMSAAIIDTLADIGPDVKLIRLRGNGPDFCRGRQSPPIDRTKASAREFREVIAEPALRLYAAFKSTRAPILGMIQGQALGVGCALAGICDMAIAADDAIFQVPEMNHGIPPTLVMSALNGRVAPGPLGYLVYSRDRISAAKAESLGIVSKTVPATQLADEVRALSERISSGPASSLQAVKDYLRSAHHMDQYGADSFAANLIATVLSSHRAG
jgi:enoyl-CoA hydratase/carnithine racemase